MHVSRSDARAEHCFQTKKGTFCIVELEKGAGISMQGSDAPAFVAKSGGKFSKMPCSEEREHTWNM